MTAVDAEISSKRRKDRDIYELIQDSPQGSGRLYDNFVVAIAQPSDEGTHYILSLEQPSGRRVVLDDVRNSYTSPLAF